ncbi:MAG: hypothetical protein QOC59_117 [Microbacteriaceae bacterium]|nr:hypothetical protein [Microbacteriaceae bacterium]
MRSVHTRLAAAAAVLVLGAVTASVAPSASAAATTAMAYDFNGDGYADLAVGVPGEDQGATRDSGAVTVVYGSAEGLTGQGGQLWSQDSRGVPGKGETDDRFGTPASGDFNGDGFADLAVGAPGERVGGLAAAGGVTVLYGSSHGLRSSGSRFFSQSTPGVPGDPDRNAQFGAALVAGDFNGDHRDDLAVGAPRDDIGADDNDQGSVTVLLGSGSGLRTTGAQEWDTGSILGRGQGLTGSALDAGDIDGDGRDDLAVLGVDAATILLGAPKGLTSFGSQVWDATRSGIAAALPKAGRVSSLALGDFNGDHHADLAVGSLGANRSNDSADDCSSGFECDGAVAILPGTSNPVEPITAAGRQILYPGAVSVNSTIDFGRTLAAGDLDGDGRDELCAAAGNKGTARLVEVVHFRAGPAIQADASRSWEQEPGQVSGTFEQGDGFAETLQVAQLGRGSQADLAIGVPGEAVGSAAEAGRVVVLYGTPNGVTATGQQTWTQNSPGSRGGAEAGDRFGTLGH